MSVSSSHLPTHSALGRLSAACRHHVIVFSPLVPPAWISALPLRTRTCVRSGKSKGMPEFHGALPMSLQE